MSTLTTRLGIKKPADADPFLTADFDTNYDLIDSYPGVWVCTSSTLPSWGSAQAGQLVMCTDTRRLLGWTGTVFKDPLTAPAAWDLSASLNSSITSTGTVGGTTATFTIGTFASTRAGTALVHHSASVYRPDLWHVFYAQSVLSINGTPVTGKAHLSQYAVTSFTSSPNVTSSFYGSDGNSADDLASFGTCPVIAGTNTVTLAVTYRGSGTGGQNPGAGSSSTLGIFDAHVAAFLVNTSTP